MTGGWPGSWPAITIRRATGYFSPVSAMRARTWFLNALLSVTPFPRGDAARALTACSAVTDLTWEREPAALVLITVASAGRGGSEYRRRSCPARTIPGHPAAANRDSRRCAAQAGGINEPARRAPNSMPECQTRSSATRDHNELQLPYPNGGRFAWRVMP